MVPIARVSPIPTTAIRSALMCGGRPWGKRLGGALGSHVRRRTGRVVGEPLIPLPCTEVSAC